MAGRRDCNNKAVAVAMAVVALLALLFAAGEAADETCKVDLGKVYKECKSCSSSGTPSKGCCEALRPADFGCLCRNYWGRLQAMPAYADCAKAIPSTCNLPNAKCPSHY